MKFAVLNMLVSNVVVYCVFLAVVVTLLMTRYVSSFWLILMVFRLSLLNLTPNINFQPLTHLSTLTHEDSLNTFYSPA
jgi:hypothetical protein